MSWEQWLSFAVIAVNFVLIWRNIRMYRLMLRTQDVLQQVIVKAWVMRHAPIWVPWCAVRGYEFHVEPREIKRK